MIGRIAGRLDWRGADQVLIDVHGVGYIVHVSDRTLANMPGVGEVTALYTDLLVREDLLQLFGFPTLLDREWHRLLMTVQGIGAKASMAILGTLGAEGVARAIALGDARAIQAAPGVGPKIAQRVVLELKTKAPALMAMGGRLSAGAVTPESRVDIQVIETAAGGRTIRQPAVGASAAATADALSALINLGYGQGEAAGAVAQAAAEAQTAARTAQQEAGDATSGATGGTTGGAIAADAPTLIRLALKLLQPKV